jgi:hypothetical protein
MSQAAEADITDQLFQDFQDDGKSLKSEKEYIAFGEKVSNVLQEGQSPPYLLAFFKQTFKALGADSQSKDVKKIVDSLTAVYNEKLKAEKAAE